jgi:branched-subunit amino acid ABC-type transport system permease component
LLLTCPRSKRSSAALVALGFNLQYGMALIVNLAYGGFPMAAAFAAFFMFTLFHINPIAGTLLSAPAAFAANWLVYRVLMTPLVKRVRTRQQLDAVQRPSRSAPTIASMIISARRPTSSASPSPSAS